ncbi:hypothetical protein D3C71_1374110 [compost metagenome]
MGGQGQIELVEQDLVAARQQGEHHEGALAQNGAPLAQDGAARALVGHRAFGQHSILQHPEQGEQASRQNTRQGIALLGQGQADQGAEQHARLAGEIVQGEGALALARGAAFARQIGLGAGGEQGPGKAGQGRRQQQYGQGLGPAQQQEADRSHQATPDDGGVIADAIPKGPPQEEEPLLAEDPHPHDQAAGPAGEAKAAAYVLGEEGQHHVEAEVERQAIDDEQAGGRAHALPVPPVGGAVHLVCTRVPVAGQAAGAVMGSLVMIVFAGYEGRGCRSDRGLSAPAPDRGAR